jgi:hypothetical protein
MSTQNGDAPTLDDVRDALERDGRQPILLYVEARKKAPAYEGWQKVTYAQTQTPYYQSCLQQHPNTGVLLGVDDLCTIDCDAGFMFAEMIALNPSFSATSGTQASVCTTKGGVGEITARTTTATRSISINGRRGRVQVRRSSHSSSSRVSRPNSKQRKQQSQTQTRQRPPGNRNSCCPRALSLSLTLQTKQPFRAGLRLRALRSRHLPECRQNKK